MSGGVFYPGNSYNCLRPITPDDVPDANSKLLGAKYLHNAGVGGDVTVTQNQIATKDEASGVDPYGNATVVVYIPQGGWVECGASWRNVNATGTAAGVILKAAH